LPDTGQASFAAQLRERVLAVGGKFLDALQRAAQFAHQFLEPALLVLETLELLGAALRLGVERHQRLAAPLARRLQARHLAALLLFERQQPLLLGGELAVELVDLGEMRVDGRDLAGARAPEVLVVDEHPSGLPRVVLVEQ
jgi:hypothetical protein